MQDKRLNSRILRQIAERLLDRIPEGEGLLANCRRDYITSLIRQWITYDGVATLFTVQRQDYFILRTTAQGQPFVVREDGLGWARALTRDWAISPADLPGILDQLNRGQSAEFASADGTPLRLWVNPKERSQGVEPLVKQPTVRKGERDRFKMAVTQLEQLLGTEIPENEIDALARSLAQQWQRFDGHAGLFINGNQFLFELKEEDDGSSEVRAAKRKLDLGPVLVTLGLTSKEATQVIARVNLGQEVEFRDAAGVPSVLWFDPKSRRIRTRALRPTNCPPIICPRCSALLDLWSDDLPHQKCPACGHGVSQRP